MSGVTSHYATDWTLWSCQQEIVKKIVEHPKLISLFASRKFLQFLTAPKRFKWRNIPLRFLPGPNVGPVFIYTFHSTGCRTEFCKRAGYLLFRAWPWGNRPFWLFAGRPTPHCINLSDTLYFLAQSPLVNWGRVRFKNVCYHFRARKEVTAAGTRTPILAGALDPRTSAQRWSSATGITTPRSQETSLPSMDSSGQSK